jgi:transcriptional regulator with XRE-family HTH domain
MVKETFGNRLAQLRREHGLKQEDVADYLQKHLPEAKTDKSLISRYEANLTKPKQFMTVELLARLFRVNVNYLTGYSDEKYEEEKRLQAYSSAGDDCCGSANAGPGGHYRRRVRKA